MNMNAIQHLLTQIHHLQTWLFPNACAFCNKLNDSGIFCSKCFGKVTFIEAPFCNKCGKLFTGGIPHNSLCSACINNERVFDTARALFVYDTYVRQLIINIKQTGNRNLISKCCSIIVAKYGVLFQNIDAIIPVPSHWSRIFIRGFNPSDVIALELSQLIGIPVTRKLKRIFHTKFQHKMSKLERIKNVQNAFRWQGRQLKNVLLVDDVFTTGATIEECARTLRNSGVKKILCVTIASTEAK